MNIYLGTTGVPVMSDSERAQKALEEEEEKQRKFEEVLAEFDALQETAEERKKRLAEEARVAQDRRERNKKMAELRSLIAHLRQKLINSGYSKSVQAELAMAQNQLFWLMAGL